LSNFLQELRPEFVSSPPVSRSVLLDQLGGLIALAAHELNGMVQPQSRAERVVAKGVKEIIAQRCVESGLTAEEVARSAGVSVRTLHRALQGLGQTFGEQLISARVEVATRMLESPWMNRLTTAEIGRRAGFSDASHFIRAFRSRKGITPSKARVAQ
jgi:AraC-like DNA-binding protein